MASISNSNSTGTRGRGKSFVRRVHGASADVRCDAVSGRRIERVSRKLERLNRDTPWYDLDEAAFSDVMLQMEDATADFYEEGGGFSSDYGREEDAAIREFWEREWGCVYDWRKREWRYTATGKRFESEGEKQAKLIWVERVEEEERNVATEPAETGPVQDWSGLDWIKEYDAYHDYGWYDKGWCVTDAADACPDAAAGAGNTCVAGTQLVDLNLNLNTTARAVDADAQVKVEVEVEPPEAEPEATHVCCQGVLYLEEHTAEPGNPDWRMFIYYDEGKRRYIVKGSRRSVVSGTRTGRKTAYPDVRLAFRRSSEVLDYLAWCMNVRPTCDMVMYAMCCDTVDALSVAELCAMKPYGRKTELYGYDAMRVRFADLRDQLYVLRTVDWKYSSFDS